MAYPENWVGVLLLTGDLKISSAPLEALQAI